MERLIASLAALLGPNHVIVDAHDLAGLARDGRGAFGRPLCAARPTTTALVARTLQLCREFGAAAVPRGAGTGLSGGGCADDSGSQVVILTDGLGRTLDIDAANRTAAVGAGVRLSALNAAARDHGLFLPIDLGADPSIGGMIATNTGGARLLLHGDMRRHVRALEVVLGDGEIVELGRPLWKDNSALDIKQLFIGAAGATGIVTGATISLTPLPQHQVTAMLALTDAPSAVDLLLSAERHFGALLTAFEGLSMNAIDAALDHVPGLAAPFPHCRPSYVAMIELSGNAVCDTAMLESALGEWCLPAMTGEGGPILDAIVDGGGRHWAIRHAVPEGIRSRGSVIACDIAVRRGDIMSCRTHLMTEIAARWPELAVHDFGHIGDGGLHFNLIWPHRPGSIPAGLAEAVRTCVFDIVVGHYDGSFSAEHGIGPRNIEHYRRLIPASIQALSSGIAEQMSAGATRRPNS